ncbi:MAG: PIN domain-containing protein [Spirochaetes bacterium]|nr:PIN domain-containing protein [Spirochaetota bacterium]
MSVLVDTSVWIDYFRSGDDCEQLDFFIDENLVVTNDLILTELLPFLRVKNQRKIIKLLNNLNRLELNIDWGQVGEYQYECLKKGLNGVGIPDLIIAQSAKQNRCKIYSLDGHFKLLEKVLNLSIIS